MTPEPAPGPLRSVAVFCGSSRRAGEPYMAVARETGRMLAERRLRTVYGGTDVGMMRELAGAALQAGGEVAGVIPGHLADAEIARHDLTELVVVETLDARKRAMFERADAFMALPGGLGTLDELAEALTWAQLGLHAKPVGLVNTAGFFDGLLRFLADAVEAGLVRPQHRDLLLAADTPAALLARLEQAAGEGRP